MIDAHIHLDQYEDIETKIAKWEESGIRGVVAVSTDLRSSYRTLELKQKFPHFVYAAIGFHPEQPLPNARDWQEWTNLVKQERKQLSAIGEVGLPYYSLERHSHAIICYMELLENIMEIAAQFSLTLSLHAVYEHAEIVLGMLRKHNIQKAHFHWLKAPLAIVEEITKSGYYISVTPEVCYRERDITLLSRVPLQQLLLETDGPWPFAGPFKHVQTSPLLLFNSLISVANLYKQDVKMAEKVIIENTLKLYS